MIVCRFTRFLKTHDMFCSPIFSVIAKICCCSPVIILLFATLVSSHLTIRRHLILDGKYGKYTVWFYSIPLLLGNGKKGRPQCIWILAWYEEGIGGVQPFKRATTGLQFDQMSQQGPWQILVVLGYWVSIKFYPWTPLFKLIWNSHA